MATIARGAVERRSAARPAVSDGAARSERSTALIRVAVAVAVTGIYAGSIGVERSARPSAIAVLALALVYGVGTLVFLARTPVPSYAFRVGTIVIDVILVTWCVQATGGVHSEFWTLYLIVMVAAALRFRLAETVAAAFGITALHLTVMLSGAAALPQEQLILRPTVMLATAFTIGILAYQRAEQRRERAVLEALADARAEELGQERAEVQRLRVADMKRSEFVAIAAHEFRTPLAAIIGVLSTLKTHGAALDRGVREELIDGASSQAERLSRLVDDLLTTSRIEDGLLRFELEPVDPRVLVGDAQRASGTVGRAHVEVSSVDPVLCDADGIVRVLTNLLDNARKYSPEGSRIVVSVERRGERTRFAVRDSGDGIPPEERETIFERFRRLGERSAPGAGLGLYLSRGIVEAHGSDLTVGDAPEGGAEFAFELERARRGSASVTGVTERTTARV
jgi:signal transduction histidine kinase